jgi:FkbM family methyltransferase
MLCVSALDMKNLAAQLVSRSYKKVLHRIRRRIHQPRIPVSRVPRVVRLGSPYGGWTFLDLPALQGATLISAGLGEDASFDVEWIERYQGRILLVDPTPRAIAHFHEIQRRCGKAAESSYTANGRQSVMAYDLTHVHDSNLLLLPKALWVREEKLKFFAPPDASHVSHSLTNYQNNYVQDTPFIEVTSTTIRRVMDDFALPQLELIKLDVEGAEIAIITDMLEAGIFPRQLLVEFDELSLASASLKVKIETCDALLRSHGYVCFHWDGGQNYGYVHNSASLAAR